MNSGIYTITNLINGKIYVGSTTLSFNRRKNDHFSYLKRNKHSNKHLQFAYNKYGESNFKFEILEECSPEYCLSQEQYWINMLNVCSEKYGYNICAVPGNTKGIKMSDKTKKILLEVNKGRKASEETRKKMSITRQYTSPETRKKLSEAGKKRKNSKESLLKNVETRKKNLKYNIYQYDLQMNLIKIHTEGSKIAASELNISDAHIISCCNGRIKTAYGYIWKKILKSEEVTNV